MGRDRSRPDPETLWWKLRGKTKLTGKARGVAQELAIWRDTVGRQKNRPPRSVLSDMALLSLAQRTARNVQQLKGIRNFDVARFKHTDALLAAIQRGLELPRDRVRLSPKKPNNLPNVDGVISLCLAWLAQRATHEGLDQSVLGTRQDSRCKALRYRCRHCSPLPPRSPSGPIPGVHDAPSPAGDVQWPARERRPGSKNRICRRREAARDAGDLSRTVVSRLDLT